MQVHDFGLLAGFSAETSGGLLIAMPADQAEGFIAEIEASRKHQGPLNPPSIYLFYFKIKKLEAHRSVALAATSKLL